MNEKPPSIISVIYTFCLGLFCIWAGVTLFLHDSKLFYKSVMSLNWNKKNGIIVKSSYSYKNGYHIKNHNIAVEYTYQADGKTYRGTMVDFRGINTLKYAKTILRKFPKDKRVTVYQNPSNPSETILIAKPNILNFLNVLFGLCLFVFGGALLYLNIWGKVLKQIIMKTSKIRLK